jgi:hypothetical protein
MGGTWTSALFRWSPAWRSTRRSSCLCVDLDGVFNSVSCFPVRRLQSDGDLAPERNHGRFGGLPKLQWWWRSKSNKIT